MRIDTCDYSVSPRAIGRLVEVRVDLDDITITLAGEVIVRPTRSLAKHRTITDPAHVIERDALRVVAAAIADRDDVEVRDLASYDRALGVA